MSIYITLSLNTKLEHLTIRWGVARGKTRLRYPGFILFASRLLSLVTGLLFTILITRRITGEEFGIWGNIGDLLAYFTVLAGMIPFWSKRFYAREYYEAAKTGLVANLITSVIMMVVYLALLPTLIQILRIEKTYAMLYMIISLQLIETHVNYSLESILHVKRPQMIGYGLLIFEVCKIAVALALVFELGLGLFGAICSVMVAHAIRIATYIPYVREELNCKVKWSYVKEWVKASLFNIYNVVGNRLAGLSPILLFIYAGEMSRAYLAASQTISAIIGYSTALAFTLYPRLLSGGSPEDVATSLEMTLMFAIPMAAGAIAIPDTYLTILKPIYVDAIHILRIQSLVALCYCVSSILITTVYGTEKLDEKAKIPIRKLVKSRMFKIATIPYIYALTALPTLYYTLTHVAKTPIESALYLVIINLIFGIAALTIRYKIAKKCIRIKIPWKKIAKYTTASTIMAITLYILPHPTKIRYAIAATILGAAIYFGILYTIDKETRKLIKTAIKEAKSSLTSRMTPATLKT